MTSEGDAVDPRRAEGIVNALVGEDSTACSDCGRDVDVSDDGNVMEVLATLEQHRREHHVE